MAARFTRSNPASRPANSVSYSAGGRMPTSARHGRSWSAACKIHSSPASTSATGRNTAAGSLPWLTGSMSTVPAPARRIWIR